ncbi:MAG TPA: xanthine dehydrogenase family protein molybdopterin-binding subunit [Acidimicrobiales bacterium]|nr:xanthine dehydrogenase family protein molybdopterin-binding subunit [Acidimicrobiales bacterium]
MRFVGAKVERVEDRRILTGRGHYVDDLKLPHMLHAAFLRSPLAHAVIGAVDASAARKAPGVVAVLTGRDLAEMTAPVEITMAFGAKVPKFPLLPTDKVRFVGDPVAMVVAESRYQAEDACELIEVDYDPLPAVATYEAALDPAAPLVFDEHGDNVVFSSESSFGDPDGAFARADRVVSATLRQHRVANVPMETRGGVADYDPGSGELTYHAATQGPHGLRMQLAAVMQMPLERVRVLARDIGGAFGLKGFPSREELAVAAASRAVGAPVKWIEDRNEHLLASGQAREETVEVEVAVRSDGTLLGIKAHMLMDQGAYPPVPFPSAMYTALMQMLLPGPYRLEGYTFDVRVVCTNKCCYVAYRGPWEMETWVRERILDIVAAELGLDPAEVRRRNLVDGEPEDRLITGLSLAGVSSRQSLERALERIGYQDFRNEQAEGRKEGRCLGIGFATFIEASPGPPEMRMGGGMFGGEQAKVKLEADGHLVVVTAQSPHGQGHETTLAQVAADEMGVPFEHVRVIHGDTNITPFSLIGTGGSRASTWASGAVLVSTRKLKERILGIAAELLEISAADLEITDGVIVPKGVPGRSLPLAQVAQQVYMAPGSLPPGSERVLEVHETFTGEGITGSGWSGGTHACTVEVDLGTGQVRILRYVVAEDCGRVINPAIVEGQIRGGVAQGIGEVLYEHSAYDEEGQFLAGTFMDYLVPTAAEIPVIEIEHLETDPEGELGFRGVGEAGAVVAPATVTNAVADALAPYGARVWEQYLPPYRVLELAGVITS